MKPILTTDLEKIIDNSEQSVSYVKETPFAVVHSKTDNIYKLTIGKVSIGQPQETEGKALAQINKPNWNIMSQIIYAINVLINDKDLINNIQK